MKKIDIRRFHVPLMFNYKIGQPVFYYTDRVNTSFDLVIGKNATVNRGINVMNS